MMPGLDGLGVLKRIRSEGAKVPKGKKLRAVKADVEIRTVRGSGYTLEERNVCKQQKATV